MTNWHLPKNLPRASNEVNEIDAGNINLSHGAYSWNFSFRRCLRQTSLSPFIRHQLSLMRPCSGNDKDIVFTNVFGMVLIVCNTKQTLDTKSIFQNHIIDTKTFDRLLFEPLTAIRCFVKHLVKTLRQISPVYGY